MKKVALVVRPNIAPAGTTIVRLGEGTTFALAVYRALKEVMKDKRVKGKRIILPMQITITNGENPSE